ncbi:hypothetical protein [Undibacterium pigrum]|uniref:Uncharacterized protein n=1 Tax=Undibacterium pigrum TaxID=401470 RepID=A0A318IJK2_9BURK|nr:hypothetical protein [Undibacterium pigrum]PXX33718.1 hypothetical protein DFR42_12914 [Undibacterium pigrum]
MTSAAQFIDMYEQGIYTTDEIVSMFITWAAEHAPASYMPDLPAELVEQIKEEVKHPPNSSEEVLFLHRDPIRELNWFKGAWVLHDHFFQVRDK